MPAINRVHVDAPLTNTSLAKVPVSSYIGQQVLKPLVVSKQSDKLWAYADATFFTANPKSGQTLYLRAPGAEYDKIDYDVNSTTTYFCENYGLELPVPFEQIANQDRPLDGLSDAGAIAMGLMMNAQEQRYAALLFDTSTTFASYTGTPTAQWDADTAQPLTDRNTAVESMMSAGTYDPMKNDLIFVTGIQAWHRFQRCPALLDVIKRYSSDGVTVAEQSWANYLQVDKFLVGRGTYNTANDGQDISLGYIWGDYGGFYSVPKGNPTTMAPSLGFTPVWAAGNGGTGDLGFSSRQFRHDQQRRYDVQVDQYVDELVTQAAAGYVFSNLTAA